MSAADESDEAIVPYVPPACAWDIREFVRAPLEVIREKIVDCATCPVFLLCESATGGVGFICHTCRSTAVWTDEKRSAFISIDCGRHKFPSNPNGGVLPRCHLCSGQAVRFTFNRNGQPTMHYILTAHSTVGPERRLAGFREAADHWERHFAETTTSRQNKVVP
jgi:hypothetical protein